MGGYTIVQFFVDICIGMYIKKIDFNVKSKILLVIYCLASIIMAVFIERFNSLWNYCSIFTFINAMCIFLMFKNFNIKSKIINYLSKSVFAIFCIHTGRGVNTIWNKYLISEKYFSNSFISNVIWVLFCVFTTFTVCLVISVLMKLVFEKLKKLIYTRLPIIEIQ